MLGSFKISIKIRYAIELIFTKSSEIHAKKHQLLYTNLVHEYLPVLYDIVSTGSR